MEVVTPEEAVRRHIEAIEEWIAGKRSWWNTYADGPDRVQALAMCAVADAAEVAKHAEAVRAYAALIGTGVTFAIPETVAPPS